MKRILRLRRASTDSWIPKVLLALVGITIASGFGVGFYYISHNGVQIANTVSGNAYASAGNSSSFAGGMNVVVTNGTITSN